MYVRPRARFRPRNAGGAPFSPALLFTGGTVGAWYDPSDYSTLFQDSAGTTPVTAVEQPVGLMLDKSQGLVLGSEATSGAWLNGHTTTFDTFTSTGPSSFTATTTGAKAPRVAVLASLPAAGWYWIEFTATFTGGSFSTVGVSNTGSPYSAAVATTVLPATGVAFRTLIYTSAAREYLTVTFNATGASTLSVTGVSVKSYAGNHASQATAASRPVLRARYNLLTYSEQFDNATAWTPGNSTVTANQTTAPDGTTTADLLYPASSGGSRGVYQRPTLSSGTFVTTIYAKVAGKSWVAFVDYGGVAPRAWANLSTGAVGTVNAGYSLSVTAAGSGWYRLQFTQTVAVANPYIWLTIVDSDNTSTVTANGTDGIYIWGADLRTGSSAGTYQRIAAATDYATAGFLPYLALDGTDDSFGTNSINFSATDKMSVCAGVTKLNAAATFGAVAELTANWNSNTGSFYIGVEDTTYRYASGARGNAGTSIDQVAKTTDAAYASPSTNVLTTTHDIAASQSVLRLNAAAINTATGAKGSGNFSNAPLYIGRRGGASAPFNGRIYGLIVAGKTLSASELSATEAWMNSKTGAY